MVKTGRLFKKGILPDLSDPMGGGVPDNIVCKEADFLNIYQDSQRTYQNHSVGNKHIFNIWATQVYGQSPGQDLPPTDNIVSDLTQIQLENVFPDFKTKLQMYHHCCDQTGKILKDKDYYNQYKKSDH